MAVPWGVLTCTRWAGVDVSPVGIGGVNLKERSARCWLSRADVPERVIVCHWSRIRPVFGRNGWSGVVCAMGARWVRGSMRALRSEVKNWPSLKNRPPDLRADKGQRVGCRAL